MVGILGVELRGFGVRAASAVVRGHIIAGSAARTILWTAGPKMQCSEHKRSTLSSEPSCSKRFPSPLIPYSKSNHPPPTHPSSIAGSDGGAGET